MLEHPSSQQLELYQRRALAPDLFLSIDRHVSGCSACAEQCHAPALLKEDYQALLASLLPDPDEQAYHLTKAEVAGYVSKNLDDVSIETAESHLEVCEECVRAVEDFRAAFMKELAPAAETIGRPGEIYGQKKGAGFFAFFTALGRPAQFAALLLLAAALVLITLLFIRTRTSQPARDERANQNNRNAPLTNPPAEQPSPTEKDATGSNDERASAPNANVPDGADENTTAQGDVVNIEKLSPALHRVIVSALTTQRLERPKALAELNGTSGTLLGESGDGLSFRLLSPVGKVLQSSSPTFRWQTLEGASSYAVSIVDDKLNEVATSGPLNKTEWRAPVQLKRGGVYSWQVTAIKDGTQITSPAMPAPQAKFRILDQSVNEELKSVKRAFPNYHLGLGVLYTRAGLLDEAEREFQAELKANPRSASARNLLRSLRAIKH
jgi:hypothetical protein